MKNNKLLTILGVSILLASVCLAEEKPKWVDIGKDTYASDSVIREKATGVIYTWAKYYPPMKLTLNGRNVGYIESSHKVNCTNKTLTTEKSWAYDEYGELIDTATPPIIRFKSPSNVVMNEKDLVKYTCNLVESRN